MFTSEVFRVIVKSAGNTQEECHTALKVLNDWNANQSEEKGKVFIPVNPSNDKTLLSKTDVLIGIIGSFIFDQEFYKAYVDAGKKVLLFFNSVHDTSNSMKSEIQEVERFKVMMEPLCSCLNYNGITDFAEVMRERLSAI